MTTTSKSHGWYTPSKYTGGDRRTGKGQMMRAEAGMQNAGRTRRSVFPGSNEAGLSSLYRFSEDLEPNYYDEKEKMLFKENVEIKKLIDSLSSLETTSDET